MGLITPSRARPLPLRRNPLARFLPTQLNPKMALTSWLAPPFCVLVPRVLVPLPWPPKMTVVPTTPVLFIPLHLFPHCPLRRVAPLRRSPPPACHQVCPCQAPPQPLGNSSPSRTPALTLTTPLSPITLPVGTCPLFGSHAVGTGSRKSSSRKDAVLASPAASDPAVPTCLKSRGSARHAPPPSAVRAVSLQALILSPKTAGLLCGGRPRRREIGS